MVPRLWPCLRLALIALAIWAAGYACASVIASPALAVFAPTAILAGFLAMTVAAGLRLGVQRWRQRLAGKPILVALLCLFLLGLQIFETVANAEKQPLWYVANFLFPPPPAPKPGPLQKLRGTIGDALLAANRVVTEYHWHENVWPKIAVFCAAQLAIGLLWAMRARELAIGSALFWTWAVAYFVLGLRTFGTYEGVSFWG